MSGHLLFLGTGGSAGIPMIGCHCPVCTSTDPHNKRLRPSVFLTWENKKILIDTGPDLRSQALKYNIDQLDGVILTHSHYDHLAGLDELRAYYVLNRTVIPILLSQWTFNDLKARYYYLFQEKGAGKSFAAQLNFFPLDQERGAVDFCGLPIRFMTYEQGEMKVTGFRFGNLAYVSDIRTYSESIFEDLEGVETLIISALRKEPNPMHLSIEQAIAFANKAKAKQAYFTHISHHLEHHEISEKLPGHIALAYDGLKIEF